MFTTRPEVACTFGAVTSTHWIASQVGMAVLERVVTEMEEDAKIEARPKMEGRQMIMVIAPK